MPMYADAPETMAGRPSPAEGVRALFRPMRWFRRRLLRRPASTLALSFSLLLGGVIIMNALALQTERHPAPMFTSMIEERPAAVLNQPIPTPPARPDAAERRPGAVAKEPTSVRPAPAAAAAEPRPATAKDQMLAIIKGGGPGTGVDQIARLQKVQRALNKAGYGPLKEDGVMGPGTKQALEKFETDRKLPVRGEPQGRTVRELARHSGVAID